MSPPPRRPPTSAVVHWRRCQFALIAVTCGLAAADSPSLVLEHANLIDGISAEPRHDITVVVVGGKIESVSSGQVAAPTSAQRFDLMGRWLLPGLIDAHIHPYESKFAQSLLANDGMTTGCSMGTDNYVDVDLRDQHRRGNADIPDILAAGYMVVPNYVAGVLGDAKEIFEDNPQLADLHRDADIGVAGVERVVQANLGRHVDLIKVFATEHASAPDRYARVLSNQQLAAAVRVARNAGVPVAAHAYGDDGVSAAINAGVTMIEHGPYLSDATLELMRDKRVWFTPTLAGYKKPDWIKRSRDTVQRAHKMGLRIIVGTDGARISDEIAVMAEIGMTPMEAIQAATSTCAEALKISNRTGSVQPGLEADLIVVNSNPLADLHELARVVLVINDGSVVVNRLASKSLNELGSGPTREATTGQNESVKLPVEHKIITVPRATLEKYVGIYELSPTVSITIALVGDQLTGQKTGMQSALPIFPEEEAKFFVKGHDTEVDFFTDAGGAVTHLMLNQDGSEKKAVRRP